MSFRPPMLGFEDFEAEGEELAPIVIRWKNGEPIGILGAMDAEWLAEHRAREAEREAKEAYEQELRTLHENVYLLDDYRGRKRDEHRETI